MNQFFVYAIDKQTQNKQWLGIIRANDLETAKVMAPNARFGSCSYPVSGRFNDAYHDIVVEAK